MRMIYCPLCATRLIKTAVDDGAAICGDKCGFVDWDPPVSVVAGLVQLRENFVLARNRDWPNGCFGLVTGFLQSNETPEHAMKRELREELALQAGAIKFLGHHVFSAQNQLVLAYWIFGFGNLELSDEILEVRMLSRHELSRFDFGEFELVSRIVQQYLASNAKRDRSARLRSK